MRRVIRSVRVLSAGAASCFGMLFMPPGATGEWLSNGTPIALTAGVDRAPEVVLDGAGGFFAAWDDGPSVRCQRVGADGTVYPGWPSDGIPLATYGLIKSQRRVVTDGSGGVYVAWDHNDYDQADVSNVYGKRVRPDGTIPAGWEGNGVLVAVERRNWLASVAAGSQGDAWVTWTQDWNACSEGYCEIQGPDVYVRRLTPGGPAPWIRSVGPDFEGLSTVAHDGSGGCFVAYGVNDVSRYESSYVWVLRVDASGATAPGWPAYGVFASIAPHLRAIKAIPDGSGGVFVAWSDRRNGQLDAFATRMRADGTIAPGWPANGVPVCVEAGDQLVVSVVDDDAGGAYVVWQDGLEAGAEDFYVHHVLGDGSVDAMWPVTGRPVTNVSSSKQNGRASRDGQGGVLVVWDDLRSGNRDIYAQRITPKGDTHDGWPESGQGLCTDPAAQTRPSVTEGDGLRAYVAWVDGRGDVHAQRIVLDAAVSNAPSRLTVLAGAGTATVTWDLPGRGGDAAELERRTPGSGWILRARAVVPPSGRVVFEDEGLESGRYAYRVRVRGSHDERVSEIEWVEIGAPTLALAVAHPSRVPLQLRLVLASDEAAVLELFDTQGRRRLVRHLADGAGHGDGEVVWGETATLEPAVFIVRLRQGEASISRRVTILRH